MNRRICLQRDVCEQTDRQTYRHAHRNPQRAPWMPGLEQQKPRADGGLLFEDLRHLSQLLKAYTPQVYILGQLSLASLWGRLIEYQLRLG